MFHYEDTVSLQFQLIFESFFFLQVSLISSTLSTSLFQNSNLNELITRPSVIKNGISKNKLDYFLKKIIGKNNADGCQI